MTATSETLPELRMPGRQRIPGPSGRLLSTLRLVRDPLNYPAECARRYGDVVRFRLPGWDTVLLAHPEQIEEVLVGRHRSFQKDRFTRSLRDVLGQGLLVSEGDFWKRQRRLAQPAFHHKRLMRYGEQMVDATADLSAGWCDGAEIDIHDEMMRLTLVIVARTLFEAEVADEAEAVSAALTVVMNHHRGVLGSGLRIPLALPTLSNLRYRRAVRVIDRIVYRIIEEHRGRGEVGTDLLSMLMAVRDEDGSGMTDQQLRDEAVTLFLAGHETTALALTYAFVLLAAHPTVEARLQTELDEVLTGKPPSFADLERLTYTRWVIQETMRLYPPAWSVGREALEDVELAGFEIGRGTQLLLSTWVTHRDPRWFPEPTAFRPERWADDLEKRLPRFAYWPFGGGPRVCIGNRFAMMEATLVMAALAQRWQLSRVAGPKLRLVPAVTLRPKSGTRVTLRARRALLTNV